MISIKRLLDQADGESPPQIDEVGALRELCRVLLDGCATHIVRGRQVDCYPLRRTLRGLAHQLDVPQSPESVLGMSSDAEEVLATYGLRSTERLRDENAQARAMVALLTDTVAELSGKTDASAARLQAIEKDLELASGLDDLREVRSSLANCMRALRDEVAQARQVADSAAQRVRDRIALIAPTISDPKEQVFTEAEADVIEQLWDCSMESATALHVAVFKLQRAEQVTSRFGESATQQMLAALGKQLKSVLGPEDRLLPWKGTSFVMLIHSMNPIGEIRSLLGKTIIKAGMQSIDVGGKSAMLAVRADWTIFPKSVVPSLEAANKEIEKFLTGTIQAAGPVTLSR